LPNKRFQPDVIPNDTMKELVDYENFLEELSEKEDPFMGLFPEFLSSIKERDKPLSIFSTISFLPRVESIRAAIFETAKIDDIYTTKILYRSLIEHWIKFQFLFLRTIEEKDDTIGMDYWFFGSSQENLDFVKSVNNVKVYLGIGDDKLPIDQLKEFGALPEEMSSRQLQSKLEQFKYKSMTNYLIGAYSEELDKDGLRWLYEVFPRFSLLSSYVHGGPDAIGGGDPLEDSLTTIVKNSVEALLWVKQFSYILMYQYDKRFGELVNLSREYNEIISRYNKTMHRKS
jgi:hypothetical protein